MRKKAFENGPSCCKLPEQLRFWVRSFLLSRRCLWGREHLYTRFVRALSFASATVVATAVCAQPQPQTFTYQGEVRDGAGLAQGSHDFLFDLLDEGESVVQRLCADNVIVTDGRFTVVLDPGEEFPFFASDIRSIRVSVRTDTGSDCNDDSGFEALSPTQPFTRAPLASRSTFADRAGTADSLAGLTPSFFTNAGNLVGTVPDSALSTNVPRLGADNTFAGATNTFGNIVANGWIGSATGSVQLRANGVRGLLIQQTFGAPTINMGSPLNSITSGAAGANILGGEGNRVDSTFGTIGGGSNNRLGTNGPGIVGSQYSVISGGQSNEVQAPHATISGGFLNRVVSNFASVGGGSGNTAEAQYSTVGGGVNNTTSGGGYSTIAGGSENDATGFVATIAGGDFNLASGTRSAIGGGNGNQATTDFATVPGGFANIASGTYSFIAGGLLNTASGVGSFAGGTRARALHDGAFVWADTSYGNDYISSGAPNQFIVLASGGVQFRGSGNSTRLVIDPAGTVTIPGTMSAGNVTFTTPRIAYKSYPAGAFVGGTYSDEIARRNGFALERIAGASGSQMTLHVPIDLPHGSRITEVLVYCKDTDASRRLRFWLVSTAVPSQVATIVRNVTTAGLLGQTLAVDVSPAQPFLVDNAAGSLEFVVLAEDDGTGSFYDNWGGAIDVVGLRVTYTVDSAVP